MQTVTITCSACSGVIAVTTDDLGHHVECPLCNQVFLAVADEVTSATDDVNTSSEIVHASESESIFSPTSPSDDDSIFGSESAGSVLDSEELPESENVADAPVVSNVEPPLAATQGAPFVDEVHAPVTAAWPESNPEVSAPPEQSELAAIAAAKPRQNKPSLLVPTLLIFLVPYSIVTTIFIVYLLMNQSLYNKDPLERMLEENQGKRNGAPVKRIMHDLPLPEKLKTQLNADLSVGAVQVEPERVLLSPEGDLVLVLKLQNISKDLQFNPLPATYPIFLRGSMAARKPYTFLEIGEKRLYGADVEFWVGENQLSEGDLKPGESMTAKLITDMRDRSLIKSLLGTTQPCQWRVQLRRGLEEIAGQDRVICCVVGVQFQTNDVVRN